MTSLRLATLLFVLLLAGCQVAPVRAPAPEGAGSLSEHIAAVQTLQTWGLGGRAAINTLTESGTVSLDWQQDGERYLVNLRAPWGAGSVRIQGSDIGVMLTTSQGVQELAREPRELLVRHTGLDLPLESLRYWLLGIPDPGEPSEPSVDERGLLTELRQLGWHIDYQRYGDFDGLALPTKLFMRGQDIEVRVVVQRWTLTE